MLSSILHVVSLQPLTEEPGGRAIYWAVYDDATLTFFERSGFEHAGDIVFNNEVLLRLQLRY